MSIVSVKENLESGSLKLEGKTRKYTRTFLVKVSDANTGPLEAALAAGIPRLGTVYAFNSETDGNAYVTSVSPTRRKEKPSWFDVGVEYTWEFQSSSLSGDPGQILLELPQIAIRFVETSKPVANDINNKPIANSAGERFDPLPQIEEAHMVIEIRRNEMTFDAAQAADLLNTVNADHVWGLNLRQALMKNIGGQRINWNGYVLWEKHYEVHVKESWKLELLDHGLNQGFPSPGETDPNQWLTRITDKWGVPVETPVNLDGQGRPLPPGQDAVFRKFDIYEERSWAQLDLPELNLT